MSISFYYFILDILSKEEIYQLPSEYHKSSSCSFTTNEMHSMTMTGHDLSIKSEKQAVQFTSFQQNITVDSLDHVALRQFLAQ